MTEHLDVCEWLDMLMHSRHGVVFLWYSIHITAQFPMRVEVLNHTSRDE